MRTKPSFAKAPDSCFRHNSVHTAWVNWSHKGLSKLRFLFCRNQFPPCTQRRNFFLELWSNFFSLGDVNSHLNPHHAFCYILCWYKHPEFLHENNRSFFPFVYKMVIDQPPPVWYLEGVTFSRIMISPGCWLPIKLWLKRSSKPLHLCDFEIYVGNKICNVSVYTLAHTRAKSTSFVF